LFPLFSLVTNKRGYGYKYSPASFSFGLKQTKAKITKKKKRIKTNKESPADH